MFLQGEMRRDSFVGESRDLEPFAQNRAFWARHGHRESVKKRKQPRKWRVESRPSSQEKVGYFANLPP